MSDFGGILIFSKKDGSVFTPEEKQTIVNELERVIEHGNYPDIIREGNYRQLVDWGENTLASMITEYYLDEETEDLYDFAEEEDIELLEEMIEQLELPSQIEVKAAFEEW